jgi:thioredoxin reductase (NADPH)
VVGDGIAGLTAALFSARYGHSTVVFGSLPGGELLSLEALEDFPGFASPVAGYELGAAVVEQSTSAGAEFRMADVEHIEANGLEFVIRSSQGDIRAQTVIIATGAAFERLGVAGEEALEGRGISHCASCDGPIQSGKTVGVVGRGDHALQEALTLTNYCSSVFLFYPDAQLAAQETYKKRLLENPAITIHYETLVEEILTGDAVTGVRVRNTDTGELSEVELSALFVYAGLAARTGFLNGLVTLDANRRIPTDNWLRTDVPGVFAAGIVRADAAGHAITSAGDGATAAIAAHQYLLELS